MAQDYKIIKETEDYEIVFDEGRYTFVPKKFRPYKYKSAKNLNRLLVMVGIK